MMFGRICCPRTAAAILIVLSVPFVAAAQELEQPVGLVTGSKGAKLRRLNTELPLTAKAGDIMFPGDAVVADGGTATFLFCPEKTSQILSGTGEVLLDRKQLKVKSGQLTDRKQQNICILPSLERDSSAGQ